MVSIVARSLSFLTERFAESAADAKKAENVGNKRKTPDVDFSASGVNLWVFFAMKKLRLPDQTQGHRIKVA